MRGLQSNLSKENPDVADMTFLELPYMSVEEFDYANIAKEIETDEADIIWIALGAPKQEYFMDRLKPHLKRGVMIAVGAVFKFYSGVEPKKQLKRCGMILFTLPELLLREIERKRKTGVYNNNCFFRENDNETNEKE